MLRNKIKLQFAFFRLFCYIKKPSGRGGQYFKNLFVQKIKSGKAWEEVAVKILVVDDERKVLRIYQGILEDSGYEVVTAKFGKEAVELFLKENFDLVTLDIMLSDISGLVVLKEMKEKKPHIPVIILSAYDYRDDFSDWVSDAYVMKRDDGKVLLDVIEKLLEKGE